MGGRRPGGESSRRRCTSLNCRGRRGSRRGNDRNSAGRDATKICTRARRVGRPDALAGLLRRWLFCRSMPQLNRGFTLTWLGHSSFRLRTRGAKTVLLDPWVEGNPACPRDAKVFDAIDVMTISHGHGDHMSDAVTLAKKF